MISILKSFKRSLWKKHLIIDVQKSTVVKPDISKNIEKLQYNYEVVFISKFTNQNLPL